MLGRGSGRGSGRGRFGKPGEDFEPVPKERRARTIRRIAAFFGPYRPQVAVVVVAILVTSLLGLINPLLLGKLLDEVIIGHDFERLNLYVGLMIGIPILTGLLGVGQAYLNNVVGQNVMQDLRNALYATSSGCHCGSSRRPGPARSRVAWPTTSAASSRSSPTRRPT